MKKLNLHQQLLLADIQAYQKRIESAKLRRNTAQTTIDTLHRRIRAKKALLG